MVSSPVVGGVSFSVSRGEQEEIITAAARTADGGFILAGYGPRADGSGSVWTILKLAADGQPSWQRTYPRDRFESVRVMLPTADGKFVVTGEISLGGNYQTWLAQLNADGSLEWERTLRGGGGIALVTVDDATPAPGFLALTSGYVEDPACRAAAVLTRTDASGEVQWERALGNTHEPGYGLSGYTLIAIADGFAIAGITGKFSTSDPRDFLI